MTYTQLLALELRELDGHSENVPVPSHPTSYTPQQPTSPLHAFCALASVEYDP